MKACHFVKATSLYRLIDHSCECEGSQQSAVGEALLPLLQLGVMVNTRASIITVDCYKNVCVPSILLKSSAILTCLLFGPNTGKSIHQILLPSLADGCICPANEVSQISVVFLSLFLLPFQYNGGQWNSIHRLY